jgi:uncharacterized phage-associated protein
MLQDRAYSTKAFDIDVAINAVLYIAQRLDTPTFHSVSKMLYFADKYHLEHYGSFIYGDSYVAMQHGPVPSGVYDLLKAVRGVVLTSDPALVDAFAAHIDIHDDHHIIPQYNADPDYLSDASIESLDYALEHYGKLSFQELTAISHDEAYHAAGDNDIIDIESIARTFDNSALLLEYLRDPYPDDFPEQQ